MSLCPCLLRWSTGPSIWVQLSSGGLNSWLTTCNLLTYYLVQLTLGAVRGGVQWQLLVRTGMEFLSGVYQLLARWAGLAARISDASAVISGAHHPPGVPFLPATTPKSDPFLGARARFHPRCLPDLSPHLLLLFPSFRTALQEPTGLMVAPCGTYLFSPILSWYYCLTSTVAFPC